MTKSFVCLALFCLLTISFADDCNNPLLSVYGFTGLNAATSGSGLKYCKSLQSAQTCCSADTISTIQDKTTALATQLTAIVVTRDKAILDSRDNVLPAFQQSVTNFQSVFTKAMTSLTLTAGTGTNGQDNSQFIISTLTTLSQVFSQIGQQALGNATTLANGLGDYQKSRTSCVVELLKLQSAAFCLACDPTYASQGVVGNTIPLSSTVCSRLTSACYSFVADSAQQSVLLSVKTVTTILNSLVSSLTKISNGDTTGGIADMAALMNQTSSSTDDTAPVAVPDGCTSSKCDWICNSLLVKGQLDQNALIMGGSVSDPTGMQSGTGSARLLVEVEEGTVIKSKLSKNRNLGSGTWNPSSDEAGVTVTFQDDPAGVQNGGSTTGARIIGSGFVCVIALLVAYIF